MVCRFTARLIVCQHLAVSLVEDYLHLTGYLVLKIWVSWKCATFYCYLFIVVKGWLQSVIVPLHGENFIVFHNEPLKSKRIPLSQDHKTRKV